MSSYRIPLTCLLVVVSGASAPALAWGDYAHRTIAAAALARLTPAARAGVDDLLGSEALLATPFCPVATLGDASIWADCVRSRYPERFAQMSPWHYVNVPICGPFRLDSCADGQCVTAALKQQLFVLRDPSASRASRVMALNWVAHLTGDLHQPLHVGDNGDRGGNNVAVTFGDRRFRYGQNLHGIWDRELAEIALQANPGATALLYRLRAVPVPPAPVSPQTIDSWARESWLLARTNAYGPLLTDQCTMPAGQVTIGSDYVAQAVPVIRAQIERASTRLALLLNNTLK